ncbi:hypothetical protein BKP45_07825 [Anaerobacillus alkalidiazotrophicus]|uniref:Uncharacterized protein n=1 Tax=Anaerobacillus alkalidiazotrophicus TaxID=472963 RepID=A0A1S2M8M0_9BACI|nr:hypothetical protein BKP45_07825 [Anaerobacillus alkalidiazotrophicus]
MSTSRKEIQERMIEIFTNCDKRIWEKSCRRPLKNGTNEETKTEEAVKKDENMRYPSDPY